MGSLSVFIVVGLVLLCAWVLFRANNFKSKLYTTVVLSILIFLLVSSFFLFRGKEIDLLTREGIVEVGKTYVSFATVVVKNMFTITANAIKMDWSVPDSPKNSSKK